LQLISRFSIDCAHHIPDTDDLVTKKCARKHGHTYKFELRFDAKDLRNHYGAKDFVDFALIKKDVIDGVVMRFDHNDLDDWAELHTVEQLACQIWNDINSIYKGKVKHKVQIFETDKWGVEFGD